MVLGWVVEKVNMILYLTSHRIDLLKEILREITYHQLGLIMDRWNWILEYFGYTNFYILGTMGIFSQIQNALHHIQGWRATLIDSIHADPDEFLWMITDAEERLI